jgi:hypothetical protein
MPTRDEQDGSVPTLKVCPHCPHMGVYGDNWVYEACDWHQPGASSLPREGLAETEALRQRAEQAERERDERDEYWKEFGEAHDEALKRAEQADATLADIRRELAANDREFIEAKFREGERAAEQSEGRVSPYGEGSLADHWWTRGYAYAKRNLFRIEVAAQLKAAEATLEAVSTLVEQWRGEAAEEQRVSFCADRLAEVLAQMEAR